MGSTDEWNTPRQDPTTARQYDVWARVYDLFWSRYVRNTIPLLKDAVNVVDGERVLDLACGTGTLERLIIEDGTDAELVGVDIAPAMIERARAKVGMVDRVHFQQADVHSLPFEAETFDALVCANTFHYFTHPVEVLWEARRVLRSGGRLVLLDWCRDFWTCRVMDGVLQHVDPAYHTCYTVDEMMDLLDDASFDVQWSYTYRFDFIWGMMVLEAEA